MKNALKGVVMVSVAVLMTGGAVHAANNEKAGRSATVSRATASSHSVTSNRVSFSRSSATASVSKGFSQSQSMGHQERFTERHDNRFDNNRHFDNMHFDHNRNFDRFGCCSENNRHNTRFNGHDGFRDGQDLKAERRAFIDGAKMERRAYIDEAKRERRAFIDGAKYERREEIDQLKYYGYGNYDGYSLVAGRTVAAPW
jgi:hypothetical protein